LYLFHADGSFQTLDWKGLVEGLGRKTPSRNACTAYIAAFLDSSILYSRDNKVLVSDPEIKFVILKQFDRFSKTEFTVNSRRLLALTKNRQDSPFPFPHTDFEIYKGYLYVASKEGVATAGCRLQAKDPVIKRADKIFDAPSLALSALYSCLAIAAGEEGLFQLDLFETDAGLDGAADPLTPLSKMNCVGCNWNYWSIFGSSHIDDGYLATFKKEAVFEMGKRNRALEEVVPARKIFGHSGYSWGVHDKICQFRPDGIDVFRYAPWDEDEAKRLVRLGLIGLPPGLGGFVNAAVASFGVVMEFDKALVVLPSAGDPIVLDGEPVNWHVFPRSKFYENQLHVVYEDRLEIFSFNHDYFVDQNTKLAGFRVTSRRMF